MSDRIRQLEDALAVLQSAHAHEPHPLLQDSTLLTDHDKLEERAVESDEGEDRADTLSAFGTMSISDHGVSRFFGATGGSENLLLVSHTPLFPFSGARPSACRVITLCLVILLTEPPAGYRSRKVWRNIVFSNFRGQSLRTAYLSRMPNKLTNPRTTCSRTV
jgi:hypothetical protein